MATKKQSDDAVDSDSLYLQVDENLADVEDAKASRDNLGLGDLATKDGLTASDVGAYPVTGGEVQGEVWSGDINNFRIIAGQKGAFWRFDGENYYLMFTNADDQHGSYNNLRPLHANAETGDLTTDHNFMAGGNVTAANYVYSGNANSWLATDGNIYGSCWGGYLNNWISAKFVTAVRLGASSEYQERGDNERLAGGVMTSFKDGGSSNYWIRLRPLQYMINGAWITAAYE